MFFEKRARLGHLESFYVPKHDQNKILCGPIYCSKIPISTTFTIMRLNDSKHIHEQSVQIKSKIYSTKT